MKYHIDTIPVWDALKQNGECLMCILANESETVYVDSFLGASVMEPDTRVEVNKKGFCTSHFTLLFEAQNRLGLSLLTHTYLQEDKIRFDKLCSQLKSNRPVTFFDNFFSIFFKNSSSLYLDFANAINKQNTNCIICDRLKNTLDRFAYTTLHLWNTDLEFKTLLLKSRGFCLPHLAKTIEIAHETMPVKLQEKWVSDILPITSNTLKVLDEELYWFTQKFDYRNINESWRNSKDALPRVLQKLSGKLFK